MDRCATLQGCLRLDDGVDPSSGWQCTGEAEKKTRCTRLTPVREPPLARVLAGGADDGTVDKDPNPSPAGGKGGRRGGAEKLTPPEASRIGWPWFFPLLSAAR